MQIVIQTKFNLGCIYGAFFSWVWWHSVTWVGILIQQPYKWRKVILHGQTKRLY